MDGDEKEEGLTETGAEVLKQDNQRKCVDENEEANVQVILEQVTDEPDNTVEEESEPAVVSDEAKQLEETNDNAATEHVSDTKQESSDLGMILEQRIEDVVRRSSADDASEIRAGDDSLKRKIDEVDKQSSHNTGEPVKKERSSDDRSREHRSKDHKRSSKDREDRHRSHRDKERSHHHDRHHHRDRDRDRDRKKRSAVSVGLQCNLDIKEEKPRLTFPDLNSTSTSDSVKRCGYSMANPLLPLSGCRDYTWAQLMYLEVYANGGGKVLHAWQEDVDRLSEKDSWTFAEEFLKEAFIEEDGLAVYCAAIVHNAAKGLPDFLEYLGDEHPNLPVKHGVIGHPRELETTTMSVYRDKVQDHFCAGTFRFGHLDNLSLVGTASEEAGGFFPDILDMLDEIPILSLVSQCYTTNIFLSSQLFRRCPGVLTVFFMISWTGTRAMMVPYCGSDLENKVSPLLSSASLHSRGEHYSLSLRELFINFTIPGGEMQPSMNCRI